MGKWIGVVFAVAVMVVCGKASTAPEMSMVPEGAWGIRVLDYYNEPSVSYYIENADSTVSYCRQVGDSLNCEQVKIYPKDRSR